MLFRPRECYRASGSSNKDAVHDVQSEICTCQSCKINKILRLLRVRIQHGTIMYIGCCAGSMMTGKYFNADCGFKMLDLFGGASITVEEPIQHVTSPTSTRYHQMVNIPEQCVALVSTADTRMRTEAFISAKKKQYMHAEKLATLQIQLAQLEQHWLLHRLRQQRQQELADIASLAACSRQWRESSIVKLLRKCSSTAQIP